jgi:hypothetical protein
MAHWGFDLFIVISGLAIITMLAALSRAIDYKKTVPGGEVGKIWNIITSLAAFFFIAYLTTPFFVLLSQTAKDLIVASIFFLGAVYVYITIILVHRIIMVMNRQ